jgi:endonuclease/exonuclease/phosphatase family metal-dependent hydrolase
MDDPTFLTWNLALLERSAQAPVHWGQIDSEDAVRTFVLAARPDVVLLQELPGLVPFVETHGMIRSNPRTHSGHLAVLLTHDVLASEPAAVPVEGGALMVTLDRIDLTIANVHLAPGRQGRSQRLTTLEAIAARSPTERLLVAGDTNTRSAELSEIADLGLVAPDLPGPTWDGRRNRFRSDGPRFTASFTRYLVRGDVDVTDVEVHTTPVVTDDAHSFHLSDHYALSGRVTRTAVGASTP